jgi:hypothetical protein
MGSYKGLNLTRLQILDALNKETDGKNRVRMKTSEIEKNIYGSALSGPQKDLFLKDLGQMEKVGYVLKHTHDTKNVKLRFWNYEITDKGIRKREQAHEGFVSVIAPSSLVE